ncbi:phosphatase PAP2 family protein [Pseudarthrobacter niigatensis]|uniref:Undecaprenyl-diphosphatase n=1 Tax=Pseudarthrobacter niigatensis TaxID=369935 RepID=A0AAJ1SVD7_9MICC|nr:phosphatase PAP2 family protein [Pseudarthrobacter niigatensis]MDQ0147761.1 undecaprenyl-diphosphatase [Pseudarthrobacter niigatensis]MDQ0267757.1 undecaprenyl-diphosphatase [Pseudarthrobacter niigatensis]
MSSDRRPVAGQDVQKHFRLGGGPRVSTGRFLILYAVSLCLVLAGMSSFLLTLGDVLKGSGIATIDGPVTDWFVDHRTGAATVVLAGLAFVFGPLALPVITLVAVVGWALATRRLWRPILLAGAMVTGVVLTEVIAHLVGRSRPPADIMMLGADATSSFPSGHVVGASNFLLIGAYLVFSRSPSRITMITAFGAAAVGMCVEAASRVYLGYHWFTDTVASTSLSIVLLAVVILLDLSRSAPRRRAQRVSSPGTETPSDAPGPVASWETGIGTCWTSGSPLPSRRLPDPK